MHFIGYMKYKCGQRAKCDLGSKVILWWSHTSTPDIDNKTKMSRTNQFGGSNHHPSQKSSSSYTANCKINVR